MVLLCYIVILDEACTAAGTVGSVLFRLARTSSPCSAVAAGYIASGEGRHGNSQEVGGGDAPEYNNVAGW